jgi:hypothetical protein
LGQAGLIGRSDPFVTAGALNPELAGNMLSVTQRYVARGGVQKENTSFKPFPDKVEIERRRNFEMF